jgi:hypothetical protein
MTTKAAALAHYTHMEAQARMNSFIPDDLTIHEITQGHYRRRYVVTGNIQDYTDGQLLAFCQYTPEFGGKVERDSEQALVIAYTD